MLNRNVVSLVLHYRTVLNQELIFNVLYKPFYCIGLIIVKTRSTEQGRSFSLLCFITSGLALCVNKIVIMVETMN